MTLKTVKTILPMTFFPLPPRNKHAKKSNIKLFVCLGYARGTKEI